MLNEKDRSILEHIIEYCNEIAETIAMFDNTLETLNTNSVYKNAVSMCVLQIGELTKHITTEFRKAHTQIPWSQIVGLRNIAAHHYKRFTMERLHAIITISVPELKDYCQKVLDENPEQ